MSDSPKHASAASARPDSHDRSERTRPVVLVVEDDAQVRQMLGQALPLYGYDVELAAGGAEALQTYQRKHFDLVLLDVLMPDMDGPATLRALQGINAEVRCLFMTGWPGRYSGSTLLDVGSAGVVAKPFTLAQLCEQMARALSERG
jgi:CheY-like chemotaxis protein